MNIEPFFLSGGSLFVAGEIAQKRRAFSEATALNETFLRFQPENPLALMRMGVIEAKQGKLEAAAQLLLRSLAGNPLAADAHNNIGLVHHQLDRNHEAIASYKEALALKPGFAIALDNLGVALSALGQHDEAILSHRRALAVHPAFSGAFNNLGCALHGAGKDSEAVSAFQKALDLRPAYIEASLSLARTLRTLGRLDESIEAYFSASELQPGNPTTLLLLAETLAQKHRTSEAIEAYQKALAIDPNLADAHAGLGFLFQQTGVIAEAQSRFERAIALDPHQPAYYRGLVQTRKTEAADPFLPRMKALAANASVFSESQRVQLHFALGKALADAGEQEEAFDHVLAGNILRRRHVAYDQESELQPIAQIPGVFTKELLARRSGCGSQSYLPVFIVGMPRSGSTLLEQILASHPEVRGGGELRVLDELVSAMDKGDGTERFPIAVPDCTDEQLRAVGAAYLDHLRRLGAAQGNGHRALRVTDKRLDNFRYLGLIHMLFPNAVIIHTHRDPVDTCLSCFSLLFEKTEFSYDLAELGRRYAAYQHTMAHWHSVLPKGRILDVCYEDVVTDTAAQVRRLLKHCNLEWHPACLRFHEEGRAVHTASAVQVRQPIYRTSVGRWRPSNDLLQPLLAERN